MKLSQILETETHRQLNAAIRRAAAAAAAAETAEAAAGKAVDVLTKAV